MGTKKNEETLIVPEEAPKKKASRKKDPIKVVVENPYLVIRTGPGKEYDKTGKHTGIGEFELTKIEKGSGSEAGWGKLKSGEGWISMDYAKKV